ncbi:MAG: phosphatase PAP2 family protein [Desulfobacteraceae bacterium]|jgi:membrane-associated phospholipid phosphatase
MEGMLNWGVKLVLWCQQFSPTLDPVFKVFTFMGEEVFFMMLLPFIYWCVDRRIGIRLIILFLFSAYLNSALKAILVQPRPFQYDLRVRPLVQAHGYSFPSGHTQGAVVVWGYLASQHRRAWLWVVAGLLMAFIPLSRLYLGVHFPVDLLGGYVLGALLLVLYLRLEARAEAWLQTKGIIWSLGVALLLPTLLLILRPLEAYTGLTACALLMGMGVGFALEGRWVGYASGGLWWKQVLRFLVGEAGLFLLWLGLRIGFLDLEPQALFRFVRYGLVGLWGGLGAPWAFVKLRLAEKR